MICSQIYGYQQACGGVTGGISDILFGDPHDYDFTQAPAIAGVEQPYTAVALREGSGADATATVDDGKVVDVEIEDGGSGYTYPPTVVFTGGGGSGAAATAVVVGGVVVGVTITNAGTGYTSAPTISFTGGGANLAGGAALRKVEFVQDEAEWTQTRSDESRASYEHSLNFQLSKVSQQMSSFLIALDKAGECCGLLIIIRTNDNKIFVLGERYVNGEQQRRFIMRQGGTTTTTGKLYGDFNGGNLVVKGTYFRPAFEFTGSWTSLQAFVQN